MGAKGAQKGLAPGGELGAGAAKEMLLRVGCVAGWAVAGRGTPFGFLILGRKQLMGKLE
jgi:hypothetical protein